MEYLLERFIVWRFSRVALAWGDWHSYAYMFSGHEANPHESAFKRWERIYFYLGYEPIPHDVWVGAGGWGEPYKNHLRKLPLATNP